MNTSHSIARMGNNTEGEFNTTLSTPSQLTPREMQWSPWLTDARTQLKSLRPISEQTFDGPLRIAVVTDAWKPQVNGVVRALDMLKTQLEKFGHETLYVTHEHFRSFPLPTYPEIRLPFRPGPKVKRMFNEFQPHAIHICTEGTLGLAARQFCMRRDHPFTSSFHTRLPEYLNARTRFPVKWGYKIQRQFHRSATATMGTTPALMDELDEKGFGNVRLWRRGVDLDQFQPHDKTFLDHLPRPIWVYVGRVAVEKNLESFLDLDLEGTKLIVGEGPQFEELKSKYEDVVFVGNQHGEELARHYAASDVFVFPSLTDTFGLVNLEALACGIPVAAYPVTGPVQIIGDSGVGAVNDDLKTACLEALGIATVDQCRDRASQFSWAEGTREFISNLALTNYGDKYWQASAEFPLN